MPNRIKITIAQLDAYIIENTKSRISLNDYIEAIEGKKVIADLSNIDFKTNKFDLSNTNLSGTILDGIIFSGEDVILKGANLSGASMNGTIFTDGISLKATKFGSIELRSDVFENCQLAEAEYDLNSSRIIMMQLTEEQLKTYHESNPKTNLNQHLHELYGHQYPGLTIVADLSNHTIDSKFNGADISGSKLAKATITGEISNLKMRDCFTHETVFKDCDLINPDLRGTCLTDKGAILVKGFQAAIFTGAVNFYSPKLSIGENTDLAETKGLITSQHESSLFINGTPEFDPCYDSKQPDISRRYQKCTREHVEQYINYIKKAPNKEDALDFATYLRENTTMLRANQIADLSELDLRA